MAASPLHPFPEGPMTGSAGRRGRRFSKATFAAAAVVLLAMGLPAAPASAQVFSTPTISGPSDDVTLVPGDEHTTGLYTADSGNNNVSIFPQVSSSDTSIATAAVVDRTIVSNRRDTFKVKVTAKAVGTTTITVTARTSYNETASKTFTVTVPPFEFGDIDDQLWASGTAVSFEVPAENAVGDVSYSLLDAASQKLPPGVSWDAATWTFSGTPSDTTALTGGGSVRYPLTVSVKAVDDMGTSSDDTDDETVVGTFEVRVLTSPDTPSVSAAAASAAGEVEVSWSPEGAGDHLLYRNRQVDKFVVDWREKNDTTSTGTKTVTDTGFFGSTTVTGLTAGTAYEFKVTASNTHGTGDNVVTKTGTASDWAEATAPAALAGLAADGGNRQISLSWTAVTGATGFETRERTCTNATGACRDDDTGWGGWAAAKAADGTAATGSATSAVVRPLTDEIRYEVHVRALNNAVVIAAGAATATTDEYTPPRPAAPDGFTATAGPGAGQVTLTWNKLAEETTANCAGASLSVRYQYTTTTFSDDSPTGSAWSENDGDCGTGTTRTHTIDNLTPNTQYTFRIHTVLGRTAGPNSAQATATPPEPLELPDGPTGLVAAAATQTSGKTSYQTVITWAVPDTGGPAAKWQIETATYQLPWGAAAENVDTDAWTDIPAADITTNNKTRSYTLTGINKGDDHCYIAIGIRAANDTGTSPSGYTTLLLQNPASAPNTTCSIDAIS